MSMLQRISRSLSRSVSSSANSSPAASPSVKGSSSSASSASGSSTKSSSSSSPFSELLPGSRSTSTSSPQQSVSAENARAKARSESISLEDSAVDSLGESTTTILVAQPFKCKNFGCDVALTKEEVEAKPDDVEEHLASCSFRMVTCGLVDTEASKETINFPESSAVCRFRCRAVDLAEHRNFCPFRPIACTNERCKSIASMRSLHIHISRCAFTRLPECRNNEHLPQDAPGDASNLVPSWWRCPVQPLSGEATGHESSECLLSCDPAVFERELQKRILGIGANGEEQAVEFTSADVKNVTRTRLRFLFDRAERLAVQLRAANHSLSEMRIEISSLRALPSPNQPLGGNSSASAEHIGKYYTATFSMKACEDDSTWLRKFQATLSEYDLQLRKNRERARIHEEKAIADGVAGGRRVNLPSSAGIVSQLQDHIKFMFRIGSEPFSEDQVATNSHPLFIAYEKAETRIFKLCRLARKNRTQDELSKLPRVVQFEIELLTSSILNTFPIYDSLKFHPILGSEGVRDGSDEDFPDGTAPVSIRGIVESVVISKLFPQLFDVFTETYRSDDRMFAEKVQVLQARQPRDFLVRDEFCVRVDGRSALENPLATFDEYVFAIGGVNLLRTFTSFVTPSDLAKCVVATMQLISNSVANFVASGGSTDPNIPQKNAPVVSADDLLPMLVYTIVNAFGPGLPGSDTSRASSIVSLARYMIDFGYGDHAGNAGVQGELGYALALFDSAVANIVASNPSDVVAKSDESNALDPSSISSRAVSGFSRERMLVHKRSQFHDSALEYCKTRFLIPDSISKESILFSASGSYPSSSSQHGLLVLTDHRICFIPYGKVASDAESELAAGVASANLFVSEAMFSALWNSLAGMRRTKGGAFMDSGLELTFAGRTNLEPLRLSRIESRDDLVIVAQVLHDCSQRRLASKLGIESVTGMTGPFSAGSANSLANCYTDTFPGFSPDFPFQFGLGAERLVLREFAMMRTAVVTGHFPQATSSLLLACEMAACIAHGSVVSVGKQEFVVGEWNEERERKWVRGATPAAWASLASKLFPPDWRPTLSSGRKDTDLMEGFLTAWRSLVGIAPLNAQLHVIFVGRKQAFSILRAFKVSPFFASDMYGPSPDPMSRRSLMEAAAEMASSADDATVRIGANALLGLERNASVLDNIDACLYSASALEKIHQRFCHPIIVGISREAFLRIDISNLEVVTQIRFPKIKRWKYRAPTFYLEFRNHDAAGDRIEVYSFQTLDGVRIQTALHEVIDETLGAET